MKKKNAPDSSKKALRHIVNARYTFCVADNNRKRQPFISQLSYERSRIHAAAVYCSDGRVGEHFDEFLQNHLNLPRYDRVALPGGPACIADHPQASLQAQGVVEELRFLVEVHQLSRIVLIAHEGCAFYVSRLEQKGTRLELLQRADLVRAAANIHRVTGLSAIEAYFARFAENRVCFEPVDV